VEIVWRLQVGELGTHTEPYPADRKPFPLRSGIWLPDDYGTST
jgi:hypothetical protein